MKECFRCRSPGPFYKDDSYCKKCRNEISVVLRRQRRNDLKVLVDKIKDVPCRDCGLKFPACAMDFDHFDGTKKLKGIAKMINEGYAVEAILKEIEKCEVVCACCHRIRTHSRGQF